MHQLDQPGGLFRGHQLPLLTGEREGFAMLRVSVGMRFVPVGLAGLCEQDERRGVSGLKAEREVEEDEGIDIEMDDPDHVEKNPNRHDQGLPNEEHGSAKEAGEGLRLERKPIVPEDSGEMVMRKMKAKMMVTSLHGSRRVRCIHPTIVVILLRSVESSKKHQNFVDHHS